MSLAIPAIAQQEAQPTGDLTPLHVVAQAPAPVDLMPFADARYWIVKQDLRYYIGKSTHALYVPRGFVTDLASIPPALQSVIQQNGRYLLPAIIHDYLYWTQSCTREQSDKIFLLAMIENLVLPVHRIAIFEAVRLAGGTAWEENARERTAMRPRIIPEDRLNIGANVYWPVYQRQLMADNITGVYEYPVKKTICERADLPITEALGTK